MLEILDGEEIYLDDFGYKLAKEINETEKKLPPEQRVIPEELITSFDEIHKDFCD